MEKQKDSNSRQKFVRKKTLQATLKEVSQQMYARNKELLDTNKILSLLRIIDTLVLESHVSTKMVCQHIAEAITQSTGYPFVGLLTNSSSHREDLKLQGWSSGLGGMTEVEDILRRPIHIQEVDQWFNKFQSTGLFSLEEVSDKDLALFINRTDKEAKILRKNIPIQSVYVMKLHARRRLVGLLVVGFSSSFDEIPQTDINLLERVGESTGVALDNKLLFEENQRVLRQLQESNQKLKALDETKDEFISMASHQLRTPLTSVKGYVSMVLEGDAGPLNDMQKKLLEQSFISSQRMVFLIADLLNLSRLKTGRFVVDSVPTNLADVIEGEVQQLKETAAGKNMTLIYNQPKTFPTLMLDETKIRQVIMNFVDNAIYYTPAGGKIEINLVENEKSVEFTVKDNGIGVPAVEQHHLFNKFYRAKNAQKARPDGTGLGLFMAKKVIIAQGGALIFHSVVDKGSTFGFSFAKEKLKVEAPTSSSK